VCEEGEKEVEVSFDAYSCQQIGEECPVGYENAPGTNRCYMVDDQSGFGWEAASASCIADGAELLTLDTDAEFEAVRAWLKTQDAERDIFVSARWQDNDGTGTFSEANYQWPDGSIVNSDHWARKQPDQNSRIGDPTAIVIYRKRGYKYDNRPADKPAGHACEKPMLAGESVPCSSPCDECTGEVVVTPSTITLCKDKSTQPGQSCDEECVCRFGTDSQISTFDGELVALPGTGVFTLAEGLLDSSNNCSFNIEISVGEEASPKFAVVASRYLVIDILGVEVVMAENNQALVGNEAVAVPYTHQDGHFTIAFVEGGGIQFESATCDMKVQFGCKVEAFIQVCKDNLSSGQIGMCGTCSELTPDPFQTPGGSDLSSFEDEAINLNNLI